MNEKKKLVIDAGLTLFSTKGFYTTSVQEIAQQAGVSKGAFYIHFKSKEDLLLSIYKYYFETVTEELEKIKQQELSPVEVLTQQLEVFIQTIDQEKEFIFMHIQDNITVNQEIDDFLKKIRIQTFEWSVNRLEAIYGNSLEEKMIDGTILLDGLLFGFVKWIVASKSSIDYKNLAQFIVRRLDDTIQGMLKEKTPPIVTKATFMEQFPICVRNNRNESVRNYLLHIQEKMDSSEERRQELNETIAILLNELKKDQPQRILFKGMLSQFANEPSIQDEIQAIFDELGIK
ncbi:TetR/AcrR family transcriptional regulator [Bacillaceae bacterium S4-13-58]